MREMDSAVCDLPLEALAALLSKNESDIKKQCLEYILHLTSDPVKCKSLFESHQIILEIINSAESSTELGRLALNSLINISSVEEGAEVIYSVEIFEDWYSKSTFRLLSLALNRKSKYAEQASNVLCNMTTSESLAIRVAKVFMSTPSVHRLAFEPVRNKKYNPTCPNLSQHLCQLFGNLAQSTDFQSFLLSEESSNLFCSILPIITHGESALQRRGIVSTIYNCLFSSQNHSILLNPPFSILSYLLYPLAGPEEFDDDEVEKMPIDLQYLPSDKKREPNGEIRKLLLKSLLMLCDTKNSRQFLRNQQAYLILREYHKWEKDPRLLLACENVVDILIRTEDEIGLDKFTNLEIPDDLKEKFEKIDADIQDK